MSTSKNIRARKTVRPVRLVKLSFLKYFEFLLLDVVFFDAPRFALFIDNYSKGMNQAVNQTKLCCFFRNKTFPKESQLLRTLLSPLLSCLELEICPSSLIGKNILTCFFGAAKQLKTFMSLEQRKCPKKTAFEHLQLECPQKWKMEHTKEDASKTILTSAQKKRERATHHVFPCGQYQENQYLLRKLAIKPKILKKLGKIAKTINYDHALHFMIVSYEWEGTYTRNYRLERVVKKIHHLYIYQEMKYISIYIKKTSETNWEFFLLHTKVIL